MDMILSCVRKLHHGHGRTSSTTTPISTSTCWQWIIGQMGRLPNAAAGSMFVVLSACLCGQ